MRSRLIKLLAAIIGGGSWLVMIVPILVYEKFSDLEWKKENTNGTKGSS
jgi:hypothetical protein